jgi:hypothetical protein
MNDPAFSRVDGDVFDAALVFEQDEVARSQGAPLGPNARADLRLLLL